ncbi:MAG: ABC transporter permease [Bacteroidota bacterium]
MLRYNFLIALRNLYKNKLYSIINIAGLSIGMTCFILIALYIQYEFSYDTQHEKSDQIYRIVQQQKGNVFMGTDRFALTPMPLAPAIRERIPEIEHITTFTVREILLSNQAEAFYEEGLYADEELFEVFDFPLVEGQIKEVLKDPNAIILTECLADKFFGNSSPLNKILDFNGEKNLVVKGVIEDPPTNQHFHFGFISALENSPYYNGNKDLWHSNNYRTYLVLPDHVDPNAFSKKLSIFDEDLTAGYRNLPMVPEFYLQALVDIHLYSHINMELSQNGDIRYVIFFASIALIILLLASINYMNLAIASSAQRAKEVGMRKVLGAKRKQLLSQFLGESFMLSILSFLISIFLAKLLLPFFNALLELEISFSLLESDSYLLPALFLLAILIGGFSGLYPAFFLSRVSVIQALKGGILNLHKKGAFLRNTLVVGQFTAAIVLAIGSLIIFLQLRYTQDKKLGYNRDQLLYVTYRTDNSKISQQTEAIRYELKKNPSIQGVSFTLDLPLNSGDQGLVDSWEGNAEGSTIQIYRNYVDYDFLDLLEIELVDGRNFSRDFPTDSSRTYLLNEAAVKLLGWETAIGKEFNNGRVIGVVKDFHFQPLSLAIEPMFIRFFTSIYSSYSNIAIKIDMNQSEEALEHIRKTLTTFAPQVPFEYKFLDESYNRLYGFEQRLSTVFNIFTLLAIFIACMGALGLISYHVSQRTKEIGIRKVIGASAVDIVSLLSRDFLKLVVIASLIAFPLAWYGIHKWLENFAYRVEVRWWWFTIVGLVAIALAFIAVGSQTLKAALSKPVNALRSE